MQEKVGLPTAQDDVNCSLEMLSVEETLSSLLP